MTDSRSARPDIPMTDHALLQEHLGGLLTEAIRRQFWMLFLLPDDTLAPVILPTDLPPDPHGIVDSGEGPMTHASAVARMVDRLTTEFGFGAAVFVWERTGGPEVGEHERAWALALARECASRAVRIRAQFVLSDAGVRLLAPDDDLAPVGAG